MLDSAVELVGWVTLVVFVGKCVHNVGHFIYVVFLSQWLGHGMEVRKHCGPWAVVTGATDGIGKSFAKQLAAAGLNVVLISRTASKLQAVANELKAQYGSIEVKTIAVDFTESKSIYPKLKAELDQLEVGILVNNVGMLIGFRPFADFEDDQGFHDMIICNTIPVTRMSHIVLQQMVKRKRGVIVNLSSLSAIGPTPLLSVYGATKAYIQKFSQDLNTEYKEHGIKILTLNPGFVGTNMISHAKPSLFSPTPDTVAAACLRSLGLEDRTAGFWFHRIQLYFGELATFIMPRDFFSRFLMNQMAVVGRKEMEATTKTR